MFSTQFGIEAVFFISRAANKTAAIKVVDQITQIRPGKKDGLIIFKQGYVSNLHESMGAVFFVDRPRFQCRIVGWSSEVEGYQRNKLGQLEVSYLPLDLPAAYKAFITRPPQPAIPGLKVHTIIRLFSGCVFLLPYLWSLRTELFP